MKKKKMDISLYDLLPDDKQSRETLHHRTKYISTVKKTNDINKSLAGSVCIRLGKNNKYCIPFGDIVEVRENELIAPIPKVPHIIAGVINWRGKLLTVIDLGKFLSIKEDTSQATNGVIVVSDQNITLGLLANDIVGSQDYDIAALEPPLPMHGIVKPEYIIGLVKGKVAVLNTKNIFIDIQHEISKWRM